MSLFDLSGVQFLASGLAFLHYALCLHPVHLMMLLRIFSKLCIVHSLSGAININLGHIKSKKIGNADNQTQSCRVRSKNAIHCAVQPHFRVKIFGRIVSDARIGQPALILEGQLSLRPKAVSIEKACSSK